jgi:fatty acid CoA ligase FadD32
MGFHNPFLRDGQLRFPDNGSVVRHVEKWAKVRGDKLAYRFVDFSTERDGVRRELNWAQFSVRNRAVAARLQQVTQPGDRVAILCPQNLEYMIAFFGTLYAGRVAVPLFDPAEPGHVGRLHAVLDDCGPTAILTTTDSAEGVRKFFRSRPANERPRVIAVDAVPDEVGVTWEHVDISTETIAYLQYTSGSTRIPTGVQITHLNLATNVVQVIEALDGEEGDRGVSWLPFFHDMGLITALVAPMIGHYVTFMTPAAFVRRPGRWIREMARKPDDTGGVISVAPNFAFDHAAARGVPKDGEEPLDLSNVKAVLNGSEPISAAPVQRSVQSVRVQARGHQARLRARRGDAVRVDHPGQRAAEDRQRRPRRLEQSSVHRGAGGFADRGGAGLRGQGGHRRVGHHRRCGLGHRAARRADR